MNTQTNILHLNGSKVLNIEIIQNGNGRNGGMRHHLQVIRHHVRHNPLHKPLTTFIPASRIRLHRSNIRRRGTNVGLAVRTNSIGVVGKVPADETTPSAAITTKVKLLGLGSVTGGQEKWRIERRFPRDPTMELWLTSLITVPRGNDMRSFKLTVETGAAIVSGRRSEIRID
nr:hypothetical protein Itr_chr05CG20640 [Ipomoea trifida]